MGGEVSTQKDPQSGPKLDPPTPLSPSRSRKSSTTSNSSSGSSDDAKKDHGESDSDGPPSPDSTSDVDISDTEEENKPDDDFIDPNIEGFHVGHTDNFKENEMTEIKINEKFTILVGKFKDKFYGFGSKCPHRGAPLIKGHLSDGIVKCPWHGACFDISTGEIEDYPGDECIPTYKVHRDDHGELTVYPTNFSVYKIQKPIPQGKIRDGKRAFVILGAGAAGVVCAQTLRENNFKGRIVMISKDANLPYDRTKLSKGIPQNWEDIKLKDEIWFQQAQIELVLNAEAYKIDFEKKKVKIRNHDPLYYSKLLIATGCRSSIPQGIPGTNLKNVLTMYSFKDGKKLRRKCEGKNIIIQGSGFIGLELLSILSKICSGVTVLCRSKFPYMSLFGESFGSIMLALIQEKYPTVNFITCDEAKEIIGNEKGVVCKVITAKNQDIPCDVLIYAIGGTPNTEFINGNQASKMDINTRGLIPVSEYMETSLKDIYAAGDIAQIPLKCAVAKNANVPHWCMAQKMGKIAALKAIADMKQPTKEQKLESIFNTVPFLYTAVAGVNVRFVGNVAQWKKNYVFGNPKEMKFCIVYKHETKIISCLTVNCDPICAKMSFDIQNEVEFPDDEFPKYITEIFPDKPTN